MNRYFGEDSSFIDSQIQCIHVYFQQVKSIVDSGVNCVVSGGKFGDLYLHFLNKYNVMAVRLQSKFDIRRLCRTVNAQALPRIVSLCGFHNLVTNILHVSVLFLGDPFSRAARQVLGGLLR